MNHIKKISNITLIIGLILLLFIGNFLILFSIVTSQVENYIQKGDLMFNEDSWIQVEHILNGTQIGDFNETSLLNIDEEYHIINSTEVGGVQKVAVEYNYNFSNFHKQGIKSINLNYSSNAYTTPPDFLFEWGIEGGYVMNPRGITVNDSGYIFVSDPFNDSVQVFKPDGTHIMNLEEKSGISLNDPSGITVNSSNYIYVAEQGEMGINPRVRIFKPGGEFITQFGSWGTGDGEFLRPMGIAINSTGHVYIGDADKNGIQVFSPNGDFLFKFGVPIGSDGDITRPWSVAINQTDHVYVLSSNTFIKVFTPDGKFINSWDSRDVNASKLHYILDIEIDPLGFVHIIDERNDRIRVYTSDGNYLYGWGTEGTGEGQFISPWAIAINNSGHIYVTDLGNQRIQVFRGLGLLNTRISFYNYSSDTWRLVLNETGIGPLNCDLIKHQNLSHFFNNGCILKIKVEITNFTNLLWFICFINQLYLNVSPYAYYLDIFYHLENGKYIPPGIIQLSEEKDFNISLRYRTRIGPYYDSWTNSSFYFKINQDLWKGPYHLSSDYGHITSNFVIRKDNYTTNDDLFYYLQFNQFDEESRPLQNYYWTQDGIKYNASEARSCAFHKRVSSVLYQLTLNYSVWYKAQVETKIATDQGYNTTLHPWIPITNTNISLNFNNLTGLQRNFSVDCNEEPKIAHIIEEESKKIPSINDSSFNLSHQVQSPFILSLNMSVLNISIPEICFDSVFENRNLMFTRSMLNLTFNGIESFPNFHRKVMKFSSDNAIIRFDCFTGIMVHFECWDDTVNSSQIITFTLIDNNQSYPINLDVDKRNEIVDEGFFIIPNYLLEIIYDPPGDHSFSSYTAGSKVTKGFSFESKSSSGYFVESQFTIFCIGTGMDMSSQSHSSEEYDVEVELMYEKTLTSSLNSENAELIGPGRGDLYYGAGLIIQYFILMDNYYIVINDTDPINGHLDDKKIWENGSRIDYGLNMSSQFSVLGAYLEEYNLTHLKDNNIFADNYISSAEEEFVEEIDDSPLLWTPEYFIEFFFSNTTRRTTTTSYTVEFHQEHFFCWDFALSLKAGIASIKVMTASGKIGMNFDFSSTTTSITATVENKEIKCHLEDDDGIPIGEHDQFLVHIYKDLRYNTFGYIIDENYTYTSRPYEFRTQDRRSPTQSELFNLNYYVRNTLDLTCGTLDEETGISGVEFYYDNDPIFDEDSILIGYQDSALSNNSNIYNILWDTTGLYGTYYLFTIVYDGASPVRNSLVSGTSTVFIDNILPSIYHVRAYEPFRDAINLYASVFDSDSGIDYVEYWKGSPSDQNSELLGISFDSSSSFNFIWATDPEGSDDGVHYVYARVFDRAGNLIDSTGIVINIDNSVNFNGNSNDDTILTSTVLASGIISAGIVLHAIIRRTQMPRTSIKLKEFRKKLNLND